MNISPPVFTLLFYKTVIVLILAVFLYNLFQTCACGRRLKKAPKKIRIDLARHSGLWRESVHYRKLLATHKKYAKRAFWILMLGVAAVDSVVHLLGNPVYDALFFVHLFTSALPCVIVFGLILFKLNGSDYPKTHGKLVYRMLLPTLVGTLLTGIPLLYRL